MVLKTPQIVPSHQEGAEKKCDYAYQQQLCFTAPMSRQSKG